MEMTFNEYIQNPMGRGNAVYSQREVFRNIYTEKLNKVLLRENNNIDYHLYTDKDDFYIYMKVPSEVIEKFYYDVVVRFYTDDPAAKISQSLKNYKVQFFSNDPHFVYTYAYVFNSNNLFIEDLKPKMSKKAIKDSPDSTNKKQVIGYVKSLFFCYLIMENRGLFLKAKYKTYGEKYNKRNLLNGIESADTKIEKRVEEGEKLRKKNKAKSQEKPVSKDGSETKSIFTKTAIKTTPSVKTKGSNTVKTVKKTSLVKKK